MINRSWSPKNKTKTRRKKREKKKKNEKNLNYGSGEQMWSAQELAPTTSKYQGSNPKSV